jgi:hypothetical protein
VNLRLSKFKFLVVVLLLSLVVVCTAEAGVMITPLRLYFGDRDRTADVYIINAEDTPATFKLELYNLKQTEAGSYEEIAGPLNPVFDPGAAVVFSPKQVRLPPRGKQRLRVSLRRPADLPLGEYRTHLRLRRTSAPELLGGNTQGEIKTQVSVYIGFSIPIIVRQGQSDAVAKISNIKLIPAEGKKPAALKVDISRTGNYGTIGNVKIFWTPPGGKEEQIGILNNFNIYTELTHRTNDIVLNTNNIPNGSLRVVYEGDGPDAGKILDEKVFPIGG